MHYLSIVCGNLRSLPELSLIRESSIRGFTYSAPKLNSFSARSICCSWDGELIMVQQLYLLSSNLLLERVLEIFTWTSIKIFCRWMVIRKCLSCLCCFKRKTSGICFWLSFAITHSFFFFFNLERWRRQDTNIV